MSDTTLILACEDFIASYHRLFEAARYGDEFAYEEVAATVDRLANQIAALVPTTLSGFRAKARAAVLLWAGPRSDFIDDDDTTVLTRSLLIDLAGMADCASAVRFDPARQTVSIGGRGDRR